MPSAKDLSPEKRFVGLFVGKSKSGKTCAACSFPSPIDILDFDGRVRGILGAPWIDRSQITYEYFPPKEPNLVKKVNDKLDVLFNLARSGQPCPRTLILDSLTSETFAMVQQSLPLTHTAGKGKMLGTVQMPGPEDYGFEANSTYQFVSALRSLPIENIIVSAHIVDRWGKPPGNDNTYADSVIIGEKLSLRDKISENVQIYFDHVFRFDRKEVGNQIQFYVKFWSDLASTSYPELPTGEVDITGKHFYNFLQEKLKK